MNKEQAHDSQIWETNRQQLQTETRPTKPYFQKAFDFMRDWLNGKKTFDLQTSGSTGIPKTITVTRNQLSSSATMTGKALQLGKGTKALVCLNTAYVGGLMMLVRGMELDWQLTIIEPVGNPLAIINPEYDFDFAALVPMQLSSCLENELTKKRINDFGKILLGGAPIGVTLMKEIDKLDIPVYQSYGMTETVSHIALKQLNGLKSSENYIALPGVQIGVNDRECLFVSGPMTNDERVQTNDLVKLISGNEFRWLGRFDNVINSGGVKIILDKVDEQVGYILSEMGINNEFFSWFENDEKLGQKLILIIGKPYQELSEERILEQIRTQLSAYETPKHVYFADQFTKTATDKIDKRRTAEMLLNKING